MEVLLSAHDGERYILTQLASILSQSYREIRVVVRDDGSADGTAELVRAVAAEDSRVRLVAGPRLGWSGSFMSLLASSGEARWLAFSDQDDIWLPDKVARAVAALERHGDAPALYGTAMLHVDDQLRRLAVTPRPRRVAFENALVQNVLPGCTMVMNRAARDLCLERVPRHAHDWWLYLVIAAFGTVIFDEESTVLHRIHDRNATSVSLWGHWVRRIGAHLKLPHEKRPMALVAGFYETYGDRLDRDQRAMVEEFLALRGKSLLSRTRYAMHTPLFRQTAMDDAIFRLLLTLGRL